MADLYVDLQHLLSGSRRTGEAAEHVSAASDVLRSVEPTPGIFGRTDGAVHAEAVLSQVHERHLQALSGHDRSLRWIGSSSTETAIVFDEADQAGASAISSIQALGERA